jgi:hypothetical protein
VRAGSDDGFDLVEHLLIEHVGVIASSWPDSPTGLHIHPVASPLAVRLAMVAG